MAGIDNYFGRALLIDPTRLKLDPTLFAYRGEISIKDLLKKGLMVSL